MKFNDIVYSELWVINIQSKSFRLSNSTQFLVHNFFNVLDIKSRSSDHIIFTFPFPPGIANISIHDHMFMTFYGQLYITYFDIIFYYMGLKICIYKIAIFILIND